MSRLTVKQRVFVEEFLVCWNATEAARRAGYKGNSDTLGAVGYENLNKSYIRARIEARLQELQALPDRMLDKPLRRKACFVYLIQAENGLVKIGKTVDIRARLKSLDWASPLKLKLLGVIRSQFADEIEDELHAEFQDVRIRGEWFALDEDDVVDILNRYDPSDE